MSILSEPYKIPVTPRDRLSLTFPNSRLVSRFEEAVFGPRKPIDIKTRVFSIDADQATNLDTSLSLAEPVFTNAAGLRIWFPDRGAFEKCSRLVAAIPQINMMGGPHVVTADGIGASVFMGQSIPLKGITNSVGFSMECVGQTHEKLIDLVTTIFDTELRTNSIANATNSISILTNLSIRARLEIPKGHGVVLIDSSKSTPVRKTVAILIDPLQ